MPILHGVFAGLGQTSVQEPVHHVCASEHRLVESQIVPEEKTVKRIIIAKHSDRLSCRRLRGVSVLLALCLVVLQMLLIMSGDVEENPGPPKIQSR